MKDPLPVNTLAEACKWLNDVTTKKDWTEREIVGFMLSIGVPNLYKHNPITNEKDEIENPYSPKNIYGVPSSYFQIFVKNTKFAVYRHEHGVYLRTRLNDDDFLLRMVPLYMFQLKPLLIGNEIMITAAFDTNHFIGSVCPHKDNEVTFEVRLEPLDYAPVEIEDKPSRFKFRVDLSMLRIEGEHLILFSKAFAWYEERLYKKTNSLTKHQSEYLPEGCKIKGVPAWWNQEHDILELAHTIAAKQKDLGEKTSWYSIHKLVAKRIQETDKNERKVPIESLRKYLTNWRFDHNLPRSRE